MNVYYQGHAIEALYAFSVDNNPDPEKDLFSHPDSIEYYLVPNGIPTYGSRTVFWDHLDSMRFAADRISAISTIGFFIKLHEGPYLLLTQEIEAVIHD